MNQQSAETRMRNASREMFLASALFKYLPDEYDTLRVPYIWAPPPKWTEINSALDAVDHLGLTDDDVYQDYKRRHGWGGPE